MLNRVWLTDLALLTMALIWGVNYSVVKYGTGQIAPLAYNGARVLLAAIALGLIALRWGDRPPTRRDLFVLLGLGMLGNGMYQIFFVEGIARTRAGEAALVVGASPALIALFARMRGLERLSQRAALGISLSILGVGFVVLGRAVHGGTGNGSVTGNLLVLCGSTCWAVYTVFLMPYMNRVGGLHVTAITMIGGSAMLTAVAAPDMLAVRWTALPLELWTAIAYSGFGALVVAYLFWYRGVRVIGPTRTAMYANLQPVIALLVAWLLLRETPTIWQGLGGAGIMGGLLLTRMPAPEGS